MAVRPRVSKPTRGAHVAARCSSQHAGTEARARSPRPQKLSRPTRLAAPASRSSPGCGLRSGPRHRKAATQTGATIPSASASRSNCAEATVCSQRRTERIERCQRSLGTVTGTVVAASGGLSASMRAVWRRLDAAATTPYRKVGRPTDKRCPWCAYKRGVTSCCIPTRSLADGWAPGLALAPPR